LSSKNVFLCVLFSTNEQEIPISPFRIKVDPSHDANKVKAEGPGLSKTGQFHFQQLKLEKY